MHNPILATDSYKLTHWNQYPEGTEVVHSYFESREGAEFPYTVFFGLQYILRKYLSRRVTEGDIHEAAALSLAHFGNDQYFNRDGWMHIVRKHGGRLPLKIKAVEEGTVVPTSNVLMTVENTDPECYWLTNTVESLLTHVWYSSTVATLSRSVKEMIASKLETSSDSDAGLSFMLHDFGYRGVSSHESAGIGGAAHLVNFMGTDTLPAMLLARDIYDADFASLAFSVAATEHSIMTALGEEGEFEVVQSLLDNHPTGILSVVADSYDIYRFVKEIGSTFKDQVLARDGVFVVRPDSITNTHTKPEQLMVWIADQLWTDFGGTHSSKGYRVLDSHVRVLWGDGIGPGGIEKILDLLLEAGYSAENFVFGMGGGLLQKINRDTQRFAFKSSAQMRNGEWYDVYKKPLDTSKASKRGRLKLLKMDEQFYTLPNPDGDDVGLLKVVYENGKSSNVVDFDTVRKNAAL